jgi:SAM-dependent methyltransferase
MKKFLPKFICTDLVCPEDKVELILKNNSLFCSYCNSTYPIINGIPIFFQSGNWEREYKEDYDYYATDTPFVIDCNYLEFRGDKNYGCVMDLGSGDGVYASAAPENTQVLCVDVTPTGLARLQKRNMKNLVPVSASGFNLPLRNNSIDTILFVFVVEHIQTGEDNRMMKEARRVLREETGRLIYITDTPFFDKHIVRWTNLLLRRKWTNQDHASDTGHINLLTMKQSRDLIKKSGYTVVKEMEFIYGERFTPWLLFVKLIKRLVPKEIFEDYLTSKYCFVLKKC